MSVLAEGNNYTFIFGNLYIDTLLYIDLWYILVIYVSGDGDQHRRIDF